MCPRTDTKQTFSGCGHQLPLDACDKYAYDLDMCLAHPGEPRKFVWSKMKEAPSEPGLCRFCWEGKDIEGEWAYGENWKEAEKYRDS